MLEIPAETITQEVGGSRITFPLSAAQVVGKPFRIRTAFRISNASFHSPRSTLHSPSPSPNRPIPHFLLPYVHVSFLIPHGHEYLNL